jgi:hypothetical protein
VGTEQRRVFLHEQERFARDEHITIPIFGKRHFPGVTGFALGFGESDKQGYDES